MYGLTHLHNHCNSLNKCELLINFKNSNNEPHYAIFDKFYISDPEQ